MKKIIFSLFIACLIFKVSPAADLRIISLAPSTTEILFALGLDRQILGVSSFCNYPAQANSKEKVGTFSQPNIEKIISLKPDIIFCTGLEQALTIEELKRLKLKVFVSDPATIAELFKSIKDIAKITAKEKEADALIKGMKLKIEEVVSKVKSIPREKKQKVFIEIWDDPLMTAGKGSFIDELISLAGGQNLAFDTSRPYSYFSPEQAIKRNPDCIILTYMSQKKTTDSVKQRLGWQNIAAVRNSRIYNDIPSDLLLRPGPRVADGLQELHKKLYP